jgi:hypothetical protein
MVALLAAGLRRTSRGGALVLAPPVVVVLSLYRPYRAGQGVSVLVMIISGFCVCCECGHLVCTIHDRGRCMEDCLHRSPTVCHGFGFGWLFALVA